MSYMSAMSRSAPEVEIRSSTQSLVTGLEAVRHTLWLSRDHALCKCTNLGQAGHEHRAAHPSQSTTVSKSFLFSHSYMPHNCARHRLTQQHHP